MLHGQDETILPCLAMGGARGGIGGTTNYNGRELVGIIDAWEKGDLELARERQNFSHGLLHLLGYDHMTEEEEIQMKAELEAINFFDRCNKF